MVKPHDLLRLFSLGALPPDAPCWVGHALGATPWVVVRRADAGPGLVAVGVRGSTRSARYAFEMDPAGADGVVTPEELAHRSAAGDRPALRGLDAIRPALDRIQVAWGPTGSVGFELATGIRTATETSDLDLIVRVPSADQLTAIQQAVDGIGVRVDCQVETADGAIALTELSGGAPEVMIRTARGPRLVLRTAIA